MVDGLVGLGIGVAFVVALFAASRASALAARRSDLGWVRTVQLATLGNVFALVGAYILTRRVGPGRALAEWTLPNPATATVTVANAAVMAAVAGGGIVAARYGRRPILGAYPYAPPSLPWSYRTGTFALVAVYALALEAVAFDVVEVSWVWLLSLGAIALAANRWLQLALAPRSSGKYRPPTDAERRRIEAAYERFDRAPPETLVMPFEEGEEFVLVYSVVGPTRLIAAQSFLERVTDEELAVALAQADEKDRLDVPRYESVILGLVVVGGAILVGAVVPPVLEFLGIPSGGDSSPLVPLYSGIGLAVGVALLALAPVRACRRRVFRADEYTSSQFGAETVRDVYDRIGDSISRGPARPPLPARIRRAVTPSPIVPERVRRLATATDGPVASDRAASESDRDGSRWRLVAIASPLLAFLLFLVVALGAEGLADVGTLEGAGQDQISRMFAALNYATAIVAAVGVYRERSRSSDEGWVPSAAYYLVVVPLVNVVVAVAYLYRRTLPQTS